MGYPRRLLVDADSPGYYHCASRCVRRAFLCGDEWEHRRQWIEDLLAELLETFAIDACAYAILSNHLHLVLKTDPQRARTWSDLEVVRRWFRLFPKRLDRVKESAANPQEASRLAEQFMENVARQKRQVAIWRKRLASISWFNKLLKEPIARRANLEDGCTGHFWEGRFKSYRLLDPAAILACMVYVDLNPFRAGMASALRECRFTSILERMKVLRRSGRGSQGQRADRPSAASRGRSARKRRRRACRLLPIEPLLGMTTRQYVSLVGRTGGAPVDGAIHTVRLKSLGIDPQRWQEVMTEAVNLVGTAVGSAMNLLKEATRRGATRVINPIDVYET